MDRRGCRGRGRLRLREPRAQLVGDRLQAGRAGDWKYSILGCSRASNIFEGLCERGLHRAIRSINGVRLLGSPQRSFIIEDVLTKLETWRQGVHELKECVFQHFYLKLEKKPMFQMCGLFKGRCYQRLVIPTPNLSFGDGYCGSREWFDKLPEFLCPMREQCAAYNRSSEKSQLPS